MVYYSKHRRGRKEEERYGVTYLSLEELTASCDIVSLHCAVNDETRGMVDQTFLNRMRRDAYLINTARGDLVDNEALRQALLDGKLAGVGLDTLAPEPVTADHPLVTLPAPVCDQVVFSPSGRDHRGILPPGTCTCGGMRSRWWMATSPTTL